MRSKDYHAHASLDKLDGHHMIYSSSNMDIPRVTKKQFSDAYIGRNQPVIITDLTHSWSDGVCWSPEYLSSVIGDKLVSVSVSTTGKFSYDASGKGTNEGFSEQEMRFADAVKCIESDAIDRHYYVMQYSIPVHFPELMKQIVIPEWIDDVKNTSINLWFGRKSVTPLHYDAANNFFMQMYGTKRFTIFSPFDTENLYPNAVNSRMAHLSLVNLDNPNFEEHPRLKQSRPLQFEVRAGETLYLPAFWWHQVSSPLTSASVSIWRLPDLKQYIQAPNGTRKLYLQYEGDRLKSLKQTMLVANQLSFSSAAKLLLMAGQKWAASLLVLAACDELLEARSKHNGVAWVAGCKLESIVPELKAVWSRLLSLGEFGVEQEVSNAVKYILDKAERVSDFNNESLPNHDVSTMIEMAELLELSREKNMKNRLVEI